MKIKTKYFGEIEVTEEEKIHFPEPLPGFEDQFNYVIVQFYEDSDSLLCLQSVENPDLALVLTNPLYVVDKYSPSLNPEDMAALQAGENTPLAYYAISVIHDNWKDSTMNLKCPVVVNPEKMLGRQVIMEDTSYSMRHPIDSELSKGA